MTPVALTIAGSDPSGGAGIQADLKTFHQLGVYGEAVITLLTVQNTRRVSRVFPLPADLVAEQIVAVLEDIPPAAAKTGAMGEPEIVEAVAVSLAGCRFPLVVDPVGISKHGAALIGPAALAALKRRLLPLATLVTPNLPEAAALADFPVETEADMERAARAIADLGPAAVLVKGGHLQGEIVDLLYADGQFHRRRGPRLATRQTHGTGCVLSAAIAARLARGRSLPESVAEAQEFVQLALRSAPGLGEGFGPLDLHASPPA